MRSLLNQSLGASVTIEVELSPDLPPAVADINQLELAILNLSINSRDAMSEGGTLKISTSLAPDNSRFVMVAVSDTGSGMPPDVLARAFDPFFTTKPIGKGTGLGLSQVYGIVRQAGGEVLIDSKVGKGTTITLRLPVSLRRSEYEHHADTALVRAAAAEKLLLVDDDDDVRDIVKRVLTELGYVVREAANGEAAVSALAEFRPDLLIVDFAMPGLNGAEVVLAARKKNPGIRILFVSGFADSDALENAVGSAPLLRKPFRPNELAAAVRSAIDMGPAQPGT